MNNNKTNNKMNWGSAAVGIGGSLLGMIGQNQRANKQQQRQKDLMGIQFKNQQELNKQGQELQMKTWKDTNYPAQIKMMEEAGLNPALMYGQAGAGGGTVGGQGGGSAASGQAAAPMDIGAALQAGLLASQIKVNDATAEEKKANADSTRGGEGTRGAAEIENLKAKTEHEAVKQTLTQAQKYTEEYKMDIALQESMIKGYERAIIQGTWREQVAKIQYETAKVLVDTELQKKNITLTEEQTKAIITGVEQRWWEIGVKGASAVIDGVIKAKGISKLAGKDKAWGKGYQEGINHMKP